ncbi:MAG: anthranilate synthase component I family protein [Desulfobacterales bacterium]
MLLQQFPDPVRFAELARNANVIPVCIEVLADTETPVSLLGKFYRNQPPVFLFESVEGGERWGRYSFLGISARAEIRIFRDEVVVWENHSEERIPHDGAPFAVLKRHMHRYRPADLPGLPRFWGGLVGYLTYESVAFIESIPHGWPVEKALAHFVVPDAMIVFDNVRHTLMAIGLAFTENGKPPETLYRETVERVENLLETVENPTTPPRVSTPFTSSLKPVQPPEAFQASVRRVKDHIYEGDVIQTVISQSFACDTLPDLWSLYRAQRYVNPSPYLFFLHLGGTALVGSSPETMIRLENGTATLRPIAGTRPRGKTEQEDRRLASELLADEKEKAEHLMLVDLGRNDLGRVAEIGTVQVTDLMVVERYSHVMHLVSNINCDLRDGADAWDLLAATFPAGTLTGAPKVRAMEIISELETDPRGAYGGAVGYIAFNGNMDMAITIRTACAEDGRLIVRAGAGIVADSDPESEQMETVNKARAIERALQLLQVDRKEKP